MEPLNFENVVSLDEQITAMIEHAELMRSLPAPRTPVPAVKVIDWTQETWEAYWDGCLRYAQSIRELLSKGGVDDEAA